MIVCQNLITIQPSPLFYILYTNIYICANHTSYIYITKSPLTSTLLRCYKLACYSLPCYSLGKKEANELRNFFSPAGKLRSLDYMYI